MSSSAVGGQAFSSPSDHPIGKVNDHSLVLKEIQPQQSLIADVCNQDKMADVSPFQVKVEGCTASFIGLEFGSSGRRYNPVPI